MSFLPDRRIILAEKENYADLLPAQQKALDARLQQIDVNKLSLAEQIQLAGHFDKLSKTQRTKLLELAKNNPQLLAALPPAEQAQVLAAQVRPDATNLPQAA